ncbi:MAG: anti-sigma factor antagonist [Firmicutes bacterium]|nr:anti-sigma factor antagonist [Bacillota bacterium]
MEEVKGRLQDNTAIITLTGRIDSSNAAQVEEEIFRLLSDGEIGSLCIDMQGLEFISSSGLRILLKLRKIYGDYRLTDVGPDIYEVLHMTGFTELMTVEKAYRRVSVDGCEVVGEGANGTVYRIDGDNVVKVYKDANALDEIQKERELARLALVLGIPTAISYDVVRVGDSYGSVFEMLDARSFSKILAEHPEKMDWCVKEYVDLLKKIHRTVVPAGKLPDMRRVAISWAEFVQDYLPEEPGRKLLQLVRAVPKSNHMLHGDYHTKNLELTGDEVLLIDMDTLATGHPVFELASMFNAFVGFGEYDNGQTKRFLGFDRPVALEFWRKSLAAYLGTEDEDRIRAVENKARVVGYTRLIRRSIRRGGLEDTERNAEIELWKSELLELLDKVDDLTFLPNEIRVEATRQNLGPVMEFLCAHLEQAGCSMKSQTELELAVEEIFINIANYAYSPGTGEADIHIEIEGDPKQAVITLRDQGVPYNPLEREDPDVTLSAEERGIGGLGIFLTRKTMDELYYEYRDGSNILTMKKRI